MKRSIRLAFFLVLLSLFATSNIVNAGIPKPKTLYEIKAKRNVTRELVGDKGQYVWVRDDDEVTVFDGIKGNKIWDGQLKGWNEDGFFALLRVDSPRPLYVYSLKKALICIEIGTGKEVWNTPLEIKVKNYVRHYATEQGFLMEFDTDADHYILLNLDDGKIVWRHSKSEGFTPYPKFIDKGIPVVWTFGDRFLMVMKKKMSLIDAKTGTELWKSAEGRTPSVEWSENAIQEQDGKLLILWEEGVGLVRLTDGKEMWYRAGEVDEANKCFTLNSPEGAIGIFTFKEAVLCFKMEDGSTLWEHTKDTPADQKMSGNIEHVYDIPGSNLKLFTTFYNGMNPFKPSLAGGWITAYGVDYKTGKIAYKTILERGNCNPPTMFGIFAMYGRIRVTYYEVIEESDGLMTILLKATQPSPMKKAPKWGKYDHTKYDPESVVGEGLMRFDPKTGKVIWRHYFDYLLSFQDVIARLGQQKSETNVHDAFEGAAQIMNAARPRKYTDSYLTAPKVDGGKIYVCADRKMLCFDNKTGDVVWETPEIGNATQLVELDNTFYIQIGRTFKSYRTQLSTRQGSCKAIEEVVQTKKPFGFLAIDKPTGKIVWDMTKGKEFKEDPTSYLSIFNKERKTYYCSDGKFLFAIPFTRDGKIAWKATLDELGIGSINPDVGVVFIVKSKSISSNYTSFGTEITTTVEYNVQRVLGIEYRVNDKGEGYMLGVGEDGLVKLDLDGKVLWKADKKLWDWDRDDVTFTPFYLPDGDICYGFNRRLTRVDINTGKPVFQVKEDKTADFTVHPTGQSLITFTKKLIRAYDLTQAE